MELIKEKTNNNENQSFKINSIMKGFNRQERFELIFTWHNGLVLENLLNEITNKCYKYIPGKLGVLKFTTQNNDYIEINKNGQIINSPEPLPQTFKTTVIERLNKTNTMLKKLA